MIGTAPDGTLIDNAVLAQGDGAGVDGVSTRDDLIQQCEEQYAKDTFHCNMVGLRACHSQAAQRYSACLNQQPIPPLNY